MSRGGTAGATDWSRLEGSPTWESLASYRWIAAIPEGDQELRFGFWTGTSPRHSSIIRRGHLPVLPRLVRILSLVRSTRWSESDRDIEITVLRHQVFVLERQLHGRVRYRPADRAVLEAQPRSTEIPVLDRRGCRFGLEDEVWGANTRIADSTGPASVRPDPVLPEWGNRPVSTERLLTVVETRGTVQDIRPVQTTIRMNIPLRLPVAYRH